MCDTVEKASIRSLGGDARAIDTTALVAPDAYQPALTVIAPEEPPFRTTWRLFVAPDRLSASQMDPLILDLRKLDTTFLQVSSRTLNGTALRSGLLPLIQTHAARWTSALAILTVVAIGPAAAAIAGKDLRIEIRGRYALGTVLPFAGTLLITFGLSLGPGRSLLRSGLPCWFLSSCFRPGAIGRRSPWPRS